MKNKGKASEDIIAFADDNLSISSPTELQKNKAIFNWKCHVHMDHQRNSVIIFIYFTITLCTLKTVVSKKIFHQLYIPAKP